MLKLESSYDLQTIQLEINFIVKNYGWWEDTQISLQSPDGNWHSGVGESSNSGFKETDFVKLNTSPHWELTRFIKENNLYRTRIMRLDPKKCYSYHQDWTPRVHLAVNTHPFCFVMVDKEAFHVPADGHPYLIDTTKPHTALNGSLNTERIHIVGCVKKEE